MKSKILVFILILTVVESCRNKTVQIKGVLENSSAGEYIFLNELKSDELVRLDSAKISEKGSFEFKKDLNIPTFLLLKVTDNNFLTLLAEPGEKIEIRAMNDSLNSPESVTGSRGTSLIIDYNRYLRQTLNRLKGLNEYYMKNIESPRLAAIMDSLDITAQRYMKELNSYTKAYIDSNLNSLASLLALYQQIAPGVYALDQHEDIEYFEKVDSSLYSLYPGSEPVGALHKQVKEFADMLKEGTSPGEPAGIGDEAPEISLPSPRGDTVSLHSTRGKIVLLDFWAAWCPPCRKENPNLVAAYDKYMKKGFEIYQVSLDKSKDDWIKGIEADNLGRWIHVSDIKYWNSVVVPLYGIESIPYNLLLDRNGMIIARNLRGAELFSKLEEIFK
jgi:thiol-disulfide isomerase/thioredoxin